MSFAFNDDWQDSENGVSYERTNETVDGKEVWLRHVKKITELHDVAIVTNPAYEQTTVATREMGDSILKTIDEIAGTSDAQQREAEEAAKREAEEAAKREAEEKAKAEAEAKEQAEREAVAVMRMRQKKLNLKSDSELYY
jgi:phage head maturation protease